MSKPPSPQTCVGCGEQFPSRNAFFKHLRDTDGACLSKEEYVEFCKHIRQKEKPNKVLILFGYLPTTTTTTSDGMMRMIRNGDDAAILLLQAIDRWQDEKDGIEIENMTTPDPSTYKFSRSYGSSQRGLDVVAQDNDTGAITEVLATKLRPIRGGMTMEEWVDQIQKILIQQSLFPNGGLLDDPLKCPIQILGRQEIVQNSAKFNAELDVSQRRVEYFLPIDAISWSVPPGLQKKLESLVPFSQNGQHIDDTFNETDEETRIYLFKLKKLMQTLTTHVMDLDMNDEIAVLQKKSSLQKRKFLAVSNKKKKRGMDHDHLVSTAATSTTTPKKEDETLLMNTSEGDQEQTTTLNPDNIKLTSRHRVLQRRRYHNFTPTLMAHEFLACRRIDRMHHHSTYKFPSSSSSSSSMLDSVAIVKNKPFIVLSLSGDLFLNGLVFRLVGTFLALANNLIDKEIVDCLFDEDYPDLVPTPSAPPCGMISAEARYMSWEGKLKCILSARKTDRFSKGWNDPRTLHRCRAWEDLAHEEVAKQWLSKGSDPIDGRLVIEKEWTESVLLPWVEGAKIHLEKYREWRKKRQDVATTTTTSTPSDFPIDLSNEQQTAPPVSTTATIPPIESVDDTVPEAFRKVLYHLRKLDESGLWPATTPKRQLVMVSTEESEDTKQAKTTSLSVARLRARNNNVERSSAYVFAEGQGGASGSFSVGLMPGIGSKPPKANYLFPELVQAAFELERILCPEREPSSTIAINRNAQFRPHTDSGAGAGQSTSLIVGLGTYAGGELMVEGEKCDIRYKAIEFDGWKQRHWTLPFLGERYSLVWFTPKGCEGMRGIDLDLSSTTSASAVVADTMSGTEETTHTMDCQ